MDWLLPMLTPLAFFLAALLYASVGHAGASAYLAVMALLGVAPESMKPAALLLNLIVSIVAAIQFGKSGSFRWSLLWPFLLAAVPAAYVGGAMKLPGEVYKLLTGAVLLYAGGRFLWQSFSPKLPAEETAQPKLAIALAAGAAMGLLAGLTGTGGGIFLTPLVILMRWGTAREAAAISPLFILCNSASGLLGLGFQALSLPNGFLFWCFAVLVGGSLGAYLGSRKLGGRGLRLALALVLLIAGLKMVLGV
ncbi:MAG: sulfite exporter TauE/SafE family protein [Planctomycetota bacterium]